MVLHIMETDVDPITPEDNDEVVTRVKGYFVKV